MTKNGHEMYVFLTTAEIASFVASLHAEAATLRPYLDERGAALTEKLAAEFQFFLDSKAAEALTVAEAARATGFSEDHLRRQLSAGALPNAGVPRRPAITRGALRPKGKKSLAAGDPASYDVDSDVRSLLNRRGE